MRRIRILIPVLFFSTLCIWSWLTIQTKVFADHTAPVITAAEDSITISAVSGQDSLLRGMSAYDSRDGDLSSEIFVTDIKKLGGSDGYRVTYMVFDSSNNAGEYQRNVFYLN